MRAGHQPSFRLNRLYLSLAYLIRWRWCSSLGYPQARVPRICFYLANKELPLKVDESDGQSTPQHTHTRRKISGPTCESRITLAAKGMLTDGTRHDRE
ncbi:hypothetical protein DFH27DRAFT_301171 [Peziza echinospora]|nr:hypothetical protein DFH27DRAFT_301171 [Peziza echinospora]